jgi:hypothetical protein
MGFPGADQGQALFDERQGGVLLPLAQQDPGSLVQQLSDQALIARGTGMASASWQQSSAIA